MFLSDINSFLEESLSLGDVLDAFEKMGVEVENTKRIGEGFDEIHPAKVLEIEKDKKLKWVKVKVNGEAIEVATTDDVEVGEVLLWANVPPKRFGNRVSVGMFLSEKELGLTEKSERLARVSNLEKFKEEFLIGDILFDLYITPNRPDLLGALWISKEISLFLGVKFKGLNLENSPTLNFNFPLDILTEGCDLYTLRLISPVNKGETPANIRRKLNLVGFNAINPPVDATNWSAYIVGQPLHAFDRRRVKGRIKVVESSGGERFVDLTGRKYTLPKGIVCIADEEKVLAIGGVIGGIDSGTYEDTVDVFLESAHFLPEYIRKAETSLNVFTESSTRFEKGQSPYMVELGSLLAANLLKSWCGAEYSDIIKVGKAKYRTEISLNYRKISIYLGKVSVDVENVLRGLEYEILQNDKGYIKVVPPPYRSDIKIQEDVIEEICRFVGYDNIPSEPSETKPLPPRPRDKFYDEIVSLMVSRGAYHTVPLGLFSKKEVGGYYGYEVISDFNESFKYLSKSPVPHILKPLSHNLRLGNPPVPMFSITKIYTPDEGEETFVVLGAYEPLDYRTVKGFLDVLCEKLGLNPDFSERSSDPYLHPFASGDIIINGKKVGALGAVRPKKARDFGIKRGVFVWYIKPERLKGYMRKVLSNYPLTFKDISVLLSPSDRFISLKKLVDNLVLKISEVEGWDVVDIYQGSHIPKGWTSVTLRFYIRPIEKPLKEDDINTIFEKIKVTILQNYQIRGKV